MLLLLHLGFVLTLFLSMPYGKFVHGIYRTAALLKYALESLPGEVQEVELMTRKAPAPAPRDYRPVPVREPELLPDPAAAKVTASVDG